MCGLGVGGVCPHGRHGSHCSNEPITPSWDGFDEAGLLWIIGENRSYIADSPFQHGATHEPVTPHLIEQVVLGQQRAGATNESAQDTERPWGKRDRAAVSQ